MASKASRRKAMLQPGMCSAASSSSKTCVGAPGETATHDATKESSGGEKFGPPTAPNSDDCKRTRQRKHWDRREDLVEEDFRRSFLRRSNQASVGACDLLVGKPSRRPEIPRRRGRHANPPPRKR